MIAWFNIIRVPFAEWRADRLQRAADRWIRRIRAWKMRD